VCQHAFEGQVADLAVGAKLGPLKQGFSEQSVVILYIEAGPRLRGVCPLWGSNEAPACSQMALHRAALPP